MTRLEGIAASAGIAVAKAYVFETPDLSFEKESVENIEGEITRLNLALHTSITELEGILNHTKTSIDEDHADIFSAHILMLEDPEFITMIKDTITNEKINAEIGRAHV